MGVDPAELSLSRGQLTRRSLDLHGVRFGDLRGEVVVGTDEQGKLWRFRCLGCGEAVYLHAAEVRSRFAVCGAKLACRDCMGEERRSAKYDLGRWIFREQWALYGNLYGVGWEARMRAGVLEELTEKIAPMVERTTPGVVDVAALWSQSPNPKRVQRAHYLYPLRLRRNWIIECVECEKHVRRAFGCVLCLEAVCVPCVARERHVCPAFLGDEPTLRAVGATSGIEGGAVTSERVRQIEKTGIRKLRHPSRSSMLWSVGRDMDRSEHREAERAYANPPKCRCGQRIADGRFCSEKCRLEEERENEERVERRFVEAKDRARETLRAERETERQREVARAADKEARRYMFERSRPVKPADVVHVVACGAPACGLVLSWGYFWPDGHIGIQPVDGKDTIKVVREGGEELVRSLSGHITCSACLAFLSLVILQGG